MVLLLKLRDSLVDLIQCPHLVEREAYYTRLLGECLQNRLPNPPYCVGDELETPRFVELFTSPYQPEVTLIDEVGQREALVLVLLSHRDHEPKVSACELFQRVAITLPYALRELYLLLYRYKLLFTNLLKILVQRGALSVGYRLRNLKLPHEPLYFLVTISEFTYT